MPMSRTACAAFYAGYTSHATRYDVSLSFIGTFPYAEMFTNSLFTIKFKHQNKNHCSSTKITQTPHSHNLFVTFKRILPTNRLFPPRKNPEKLRSLPGIITHKTNQYEIKILFYLLSICANQRQDTQNTPVENRHIFFKPLFSKSIYSTSFPSANLSLCKHNSK